MSFRAALCRRRVHSLVAVFTEWGLRRVPSAPLAARLRGSARFALTRRAYHRAQSCSLLTTWPIIFLGSSNQRNHVDYLLGKGFRALVISFAFIDLTHSEKVAKNMV